MNQTEYTNTGAGASQESRIICALQLHINKWVSMVDLWKVSGAFAVHSRISDLRKKGMNIENRREVSGRTIHSFYRLVS
jgi:hypothetical protein